MNTRSLSEKAMGASEACLADYPDSVYLKALLEVSGLGAVTIRKLLTVFGTPVAIWESKVEALKPILRTEPLKSFLDRREQGLNPDWLQGYQRLGIEVLAFTDPAYPALLREIHQAPLLLYVQGSLDFLTGKTLAFVGTRKASEYGKTVTQKLVSDLKPADVVVVSGLAAGIDTCAHWAAVQAGLPTVAVFGCGLDVIYPSANRKLCQEILAGRGALVSEYPLGTPPTSYTFPQRNRIVAGLSHGVLVVEGDVKSGALITARLAVDEGRSVYAVPGNVFSPGSQGPHHLIKNGAIPVTEGLDVLNDLTWWHSKQGHPAELKPFSSETGQKSQDLAVFSSLSEEERQLIHAIPFDALPIENLSALTQFPSAKISELLTLLELEGLIVLLPGAKVCRK